jgi:predicted DCC family thiol-disulfide oxidoreductase YuxK
MRKLTVLYDSTCGLCRSSQRWLARQKAIVPLEFVAAGSPAARERFPELGADETTNQLTVIGDGRLVYRDDRALVMCLWALERYRAWSLDLAAGDRLPLARRFFRVISQRRKSLSALLGRGSEPEPRPE